MARPRRTEPPKLLTDVELELMSVLWELGEGTVQAVLGKLDPARKLATTTVSTVLRVLTKKKLVVTRREGRSHVYVPAVSKPEYERRTVADLTQKVFDRQPVALARHLLESDDLTREELADLKRLLEEKLK